MKISVLCADIRSIHNVGSIFRTADAGGVRNIYLAGITPMPVDRFGKFRPDFIKVSLGAETYIPWESSKDSVALIKKLKERGVKILALEQSEHSIPYHEVSKSYIENHEICLVLGPEVQGLSAEILELADMIIEIPMFGKKESLNVGVAFGIALFGLRNAII